jgi:hypothetical protein
VVVLLWTVALAVFGVAGCGGTTGRPDMASTGTDGGTTPATATEMDGATEPGMDATVGEASTGPVEFDATIMYADAARLPHFDFDASPDGGEAAPPGWESWPPCACDSVQVDPAAGFPVDVSPTAGACSPQEIVWTQRPACDRCYQYVAYEGNPPFPPCCSLRDGGTAVAGPMMGQPLFNLCGGLYSCFLNSGCWYPPGDYLACICGDAGQDDCNAGKGNGVCEKQFEAAFQVIPGSADQNIQTSLANNSAESDPNAPAYTGAVALRIFSAVRFDSQGALPLVTGCEWACYPAPANASAYKPPAPSVMLDGGMFTKTESLIYAATNPSCYSCLKEVGCLDDDRGDMNNECEDLAGQTVPASADAGAGQSRQDLCYDTLQCILGSPSCLGAFGSQFATNPCLTSAADAGGCLAQEQNGLETTDPAVIQNEFNDPTRGAGVANKILNCGYALACPTCFPQ